MKLRKKIIVCDDFAREGLDMLKARTEFETLHLPRPSSGELASAVADADALIVRSATRVSPEIIDAARELQLIARAGTGLDNIDVEKATERGIVVMSTPGGNTVSAAEHTMALMMSLARNIPAAHASMKSGNWERDRFNGIELRGKTIAVIGLGRIGVEVARRCKALAMRVVGNDPFLPAETLSRLDIEILDLDAIWREADFITLHTPLNDQTRGIINADVIRRLKPSVMLINCARGGLISERDLYEALRAGKIAGAALDTYSEEPPSSLPPFHELDSVVMTPHLGSATVEAGISVATETASLVIEFFTTGIARNSVNLPAIDPAVYDFMKPYLDLAEKMGRFQAGIMGGRITDLDIFCSGDFHGHNLSPITSAHLKGLIAPFTDTAINYVNAPYIARERGIKIRTGEDTVSRGYSHLINIRARGANGENELWGTVLGRQPWIVKINEYMIDFIPGGKMLVMHNNDVPNVIGTIGNFLGSRGINIANLHLARPRRGGKALVIIETDEDLSPDVLEQMNGLPEILDLRYVVL